MMWRFHGSQVSGRRVTACRTFVIGAVMFVLLVALPAANAATSGTRLWASRFDGQKSLADSANAMAYSPDGSKLFITGRTAVLDRGEEGLVNDYQTVAYSAVSGRQLWASTYNGPADVDDNALAVGVSKDGSKVFVTGTSGDDPSDPILGPADYATVAYNADTGAQIWARRYNGVTGQGGTTAPSIGVTADGVYVTGTSQGTRYPQYATVAYNPLTGRRLWVRRSAQSLDRQASALAVGPGGGRVFVTGSNHLDTTGDYQTIAYDAHTGKRLWSMTFGGGSQDDPVDIAVNRLGTRVFVTGYNILETQTSFVQRAATVAYSTRSGHQAWFRRFHLTRDSFDSPAAIAVSHGTVAITGTVTTTVNSIADFETIAYRVKNGHRRWVQIYDSGGDFDYAADIVANPLGTGFYVTGQIIKPGPNLNYTTIKYDPPSGEQEWIRFYNGPDGNHDSPHAITVNRTGTQVAVTGDSTSNVQAPFNLDMATVAYVG
jgi:hypothetical protein